MPETALRAGQHTGEGFIVGQRVCSRQPVLFASQINFYHTAFSDKFVVVSPDDSFAEILAEQSVTFVKYTP